MSIKQSHAIRESGKQASRHPAKQSINRSNWLVGNPARWPDRQRHTPHAAGSCFFFFRGKRQTQAIRRLMSHSMQPSRFATMQQCITKATVSCKSVGNLLGLLTDSLAHSAQLAPQFRWHLADDDATAPWARRS